MSQEMFCEIRSRGRAPVRCHGNDS